MVIIHVITTICLCSTGSFKCRYKQYVSDEREEVWEAEEIEVGREDDMGKMCCMKYFNYNILESNSPSSS